MLDTAGLILVGRETDAARAVLSLLAESSSAADAALCYGTLAHCRDFDDTLLDSVVHPGSTVIATALAVGAAQRASDEDIATAILIGYEAAARIGAAAGKRLHARGFHPTAIVGPPSAALVAARLQRLSAAKTADALGLAASMSGGLLAFVDDGSWSKWLHVGWSAHGGAVAAALAAQGLRGPRGVLDGRHNLFSAFLAEPAPDAGTLWADLGERWAGAQAHFKHYPCAHVIQPYLDAAIALRARHGLTADSIRQVLCTVAPWAVPIVCEPRAPRLRPAGDMDAIASLPYLVAAALADGSVGLDALGPHCRARADVLDLAARVEHRADESLAGFAGTMAIELKSGERLQAATAPAPLDRGKLVAKFRANAQRSLDTRAATRMESAMLEGSLPKFQELVSMLGISRRGK